MRFFKMSAGGNDFIVLDGLTSTGSAEALSWSGAQARRLCERRLSLGADGCILLTRSERAEARLKLWNSDGSEAAFSGNGTRCAARALAAMGHDQQGLIRLETAAGLVEASILTDADGCTVRLSMDNPQDIQAGLSLPESAPGPSGDHANLGVPCLAVLVPSVTALDLDTVGPPLRFWSHFPHGTNVSFYELPNGALTEHTPVKLRIWERGVEGETLSSGTGCGIVALSLALRQRRESAHPPDSAEFKVTLCPPSGLLTRVALRFEDASVVGWTLEGGARFIASGELGPDALKALP